MRVPLAWLRELVAIDAAVDELAERLSLTGTAVDRIERIGGEVRGVVAARVEQVEDAEGSDKLCVAQLDAGEHGRFQVVAGAKNFRAGDVVPLAKPGSRVTVGDIAVRRMLGRYESQGMLCSAHELGIADDHSGIVVLDPATPLGVDIARHLGLDDDVLELELYPNRPDLMSIAGIAREVALLYGLDLRAPDASVIEEGPDASSLTSVTIEDLEGCPRYLARVVEGVGFGPSPAIVQARLTACGFRPLGNLVDATNYVLLLTGQPLHAFDLDRLSEQRIVVRRARQGERIRTLDDAERALQPGDLVIADARDAQAIAGVMGGGSSEVGASTTRVLIESAHFQAVSISRTSRRLRMRTEASARFERGSDPEAVAPAAAMCAELMRRHARGRVARGAVDAGSAPPRRELTLRRPRVRAILGIEIPASEAITNLEGLGCATAPADGAVAVTVPSWRPDLEREIDLIEEIARLHGYGDIPSRYRAGQRGGLTASQRMRRRLRDVLLGAGLNEASLTSFLAEPALALAGSPRGVRVTNPMTPDQAVLRPSLVPGLLQAAGRNAAQGVRDVRLFEIGTVFHDWPDDAPLPEEDTRAGAVLTGMVGADAWHAESRPVDAYDAKGVAELVLTELGIEHWTLGPCDVAPFHPGRAATVLAAGRTLGRFGEVRPSVRAELDLHGGAALLELSVSALLSLARTDLKVREVARFPSISRDIAAVVADDVSAGEVVRVARGAAGPLAERVSIFDVYRGESVPQGRRSLALRLTLRASDRTLTAAEADAARESVVVALRGLGAELR